MPTTPLPRQKAPELTLQLQSGSQWTLEDQNPKNFTMLVFYRGLHCPVCKKYLESLTELQQDYADIGVQVIAISMDNEIRARKTRQDWEIKGLSLGYALGRKTATNWGLYLSQAIKDSEPDLFCEPGLFLIRPDGTLYYAAVNSEPWGRPHLPTLVKNIQYIIKNEYPARGEVGKNVMTN